MVRASHVFLALLAPACGFGKRVTVAPHLTNPARPPTATSAWSYQAPARGPGGNGGRFRLHAASSGTVHRPGAEELIWRRLETPRPRASLSLPGMQAGALNYDGKRMSIGGEPPVRGNRGRSRLSRRALPGVDASWVADSSSIIMAEATPNLIFEVIEFLTSAVVTAPLARAAGLNPVLGYILAGVLLGPSCLGIFANDEAIEKLAFIGILFLLFEAGLELSSARLKKLTKFAFGLGSLQVVLTSALVAAVLSFGGATVLDGLLPSLDLTKAVGRLDQVAVISVTFALSAKAFVLQVLQDKKLAAGQLGQAALGVLLLQDIALVPVLVLLPLIEDSSGQGLDATYLASFTATALGGLAVIAFVGGPLLQKLFDLVAGTKNREVFFGLAVLSVLGVSQLTNALGLSPTLGALVAGVLLAESNYKTQVEIDIAPFRGLLLGLFFFTLGARADPFLLVQDWQFFLVLLLGLAASKAAVLTTVAPFFDLSLTRSIRLGFLLATGSGEACVIYGLADKYKVFDQTTLKILTTVVVVSSALTPLFAELGDKAAAAIEGSGEEKGDKTTLAQTAPKSDLLKQKVVLICGMGPLGQQVASILANFAADGSDLRWVGLDLESRRVSELRARGLPVYYGDGSRLEVLVKSGLAFPPVAIVVTYVGAGEAAATVESLRSSFPEVPVLSHTSDPAAYSKLLRAADNESLNANGSFVVSGVTETAIRLGSAAISAAAPDASGEAEARLLGYVREETERRMAAGAPSAETEVFFVEPPEKNAWEAQGESSAALRYLEAVALLEDRVLSGSALSRLAADLRDAAAASPTVAPDMPRRQIAAGGIVFSEGDVGDEMFLVESGVFVASVSAEPGKTVAQYKAGDHFGEYAMILRQPRPISVIAEADGQVIVIDRPSFLRMTEK